MSQKFTYTVKYQANSSLPVYVGGIPVYPSTPTQLELTVVEAKKLKSNGWSVELIEANTLNGTTELASVVTVTATTYKTLAEHNGKPVFLSNASAITVTLDKTMSIGYSVALIQDGAGQVTCAPESGATLVGADSKFKTRVQYSSVTALVKANTDGVSAVWILMGDTTT